MNKERLLIILIIALVVLNLVSLGILFKNNVPPKMDFNKPPNKAHAKQENERIKEQLGFDEQQVEAFIISKEKHKTATKAYEKELRELSETYYKLGLNAEEKAKREELLQAINVVNTAIYQSHTQHFDEIRSVCNNEQLKRLDKFIENLIGRKQNRPPPPSRR